MPFKFDYGMIEWFSCFRGVFNMNEVKFINVINYFIISKFRFFFPVRELINIYFYFILVLWFEFLKV